MTGSLVIEELQQDFDRFQNVYGDPKYDAIVGAGKIDNPQVAFVFMNPTARNVSAEKSWKGLKAPWIGTKGVWSFFSEIGLVSSAWAQKVEDIPPDDWTEEFALDVYRHVRDAGFYITNLAKCTQPDARHLHNAVFNEYKELFDKEITLLNPDVLIVFGNQVSSIVLEKPVSVSQVRQKEFWYNVGGKDIRTFSVYYPMGQGRRNIGKAVEDIKSVLM